MHTHEVWLALGTNVGDRPANLARAIDALDDVMLVEAVSGVYRSEPWGWADQPEFWNLALRGRTDLAPVALLGELQEIERRVGRQPTFRMGPRIIDIDIIFYDDIVLEHEALRIPHPGVLDRAFVLVPLLELEPALRDPRTGTSLRDAADRIAGGGGGIARLGAAADVLHHEQAPS